MTAILILAVLITLNGLFALSELAVVSARRSRLEAMAAKGQAGARAALALARSPGRFLSTVQVGITLVAILTGAISGAALGDRFDALLEAWGMPTALAEPLAYAAVLGTGGWSDRSAHAVRWRRGNTGNGRKAPVLLAK